MRIPGTIVFAALALAACKGGQPSAQNGDDASPAALPSPSGEAAAVPEKAACAPVKLDLSAARFAQGRSHFAEGQLGRTRLSDNFAVAYEAACAEGWLARKPLIDPGAARRDTLFIANAPEANQALIYFDKDRPAREMVMEGPFVDAAGHVQVPGPAAIKEAIYCYAVGATDKEQEATGRCLAD